MISYSSPEIDRFWAYACDHLGISVDEEHHAGPFAEPNGDEEIDEIIDEIANLAWLGMKRGTAHLDMQFEKDNVPRRNVGSYWIATKAKGAPVCVVRMTGIDVVPFRDVGQIFAASEGEGDLSLAYWRNGHQEYFEEQCERWGVEWDDALPVACESFIPVYCPPGVSQPAISLPNALLQPGAK